MSVNIAGSWYAYGDDLGTNGAPPGNCETVGGFTMMQCSQITSPAPAVMTDAGVMGNFVPDPTGAMCMTGTAAKVPMKAGAPDYSDVFGIGIGLDFNNMGGTKASWDAVANKVVGLTFTIAGVPAGGIRVEFPTTDTITGIQDAYAIAVMTDGTYTADFNTMMSDTHHLSPSFNPPKGSTEPAFNASNLLSIQFHVPTNTSSAVTVTNMCISNLTALVSM
jgi:hypothetical protein